MPNYAKKRTDETGKQFYFNTFSKFFHCLDQNLLFCLQCKLRGTSVKENRVREEMQLFGKKMLQAV